MIAVDAMAAYGRVEFLTKITLNLCCSWRCEGQLHAPAALLPRIDLAVPIEYE